MDERTAAAGCPEQAAYDWLGLPSWPRRPLGTGPRALSGTVHGKWPGVSAQAWAREGGLEQRPRADFGDARRLVVITAHDDDLVGVGATIQRATARGLPVRLVTVCDRLPEEVADPRRRARVQAVTELGVAWPKLQYLGVPDGRAGDHERTITESLRRLLRPSDLVVTTWWRDGHADHEVIGRASCVAAARHELTVWGALVWMWHWARPTNPIIPWSRIRVLWPTPAERHTKETALSIQRDGRDHPGPDAPILAPVRFKRTQALPEAFVIANRLP